jgi:L-ascorbate metabolism protein UlaG (beta-lactamase superfamily)
MAQATLTWWGISNIEIHLDGLHLGFDPHLYPKDPNLEYILITHEHYDHFYPPTLRPLAESPRLKMLMAAKPCFFASELNTATVQDPGFPDLTWADRHRTMIFYPQVTPNGIRYDGPSETRMGRLHVVGVASGESPDDWADYTPLQEPFPSVGYLVTDQDSGVSFYHPGDITEAFGELAQLQGKVTYLFLPIGKLRGAEGQMVKLVRPRYVIPIHYRLNTPDWPIPLTVSEDEVHYVNWRNGDPLPGATWHSDHYWRDVSKLMEGHWYPAPPDPEGFLRDLKAEIGDVAEIVKLDAGRAYDLDIVSGVIKEATVI